MRLLFCGSHRGTTQVGINGINCSPALLLSMKKNSVKGDVRKKNLPDHRRVFRNVDLRKTTYRNWGLNNCIPLKLFMCSHKPCSLYLPPKYMYLGLKSTVASLSLIPMTSITVYLNADNSQTYVRSARSPEIQNHLSTSLLVILTHKHFLNLSTSLYSPDALSQESHHTLSPRIPY